jgi:hypothetical protein
MTDTSTKTAADFAPEMQWLLDHPNLPMPRGLDLVASGGGITVFLHTAAQVQSWAEAIGRDAEAREYQGNTHHTTYTFDPFHISASAIVAPEAVSA